MPGYIWCILEWQVELSAQRLCEIGRIQKRTTADDGFSIRERYVFFSKMNMTEWHHSHHRNLSINWETGESAWQADRNMNELLVPEWVCPRECEVLEFGYEYLQLGIPTSQNLDIQIFIFSSADDNGNTLDEHMNELMFSFYYLAGINEMDEEF